MFWQPTMLSVDMTKYVHDCKQAGT